MTRAYNAPVGPGPHRVWSIAEVAAVIGNTWRVRRWLVRENAYMRSGRYDYTSKAQIRSAFPAAADEVIANLPE